MKKSRTKKQEPIRRCIFCGGRPMTREHLFSEWLHPLLAGSGSVKIRGFVVDVAGRSKSLRRVEPQPSVRAIGERMKVVCRSCNNGWMSKLDTAVKPILMPLVRGEEGVISVEGAKILARWTRLKHLVAEAGHNGVASDTDPAERADLMQGLPNPDAVKVFAVPRLPEILPLTNAADYWAEAWEINGFTSPDGDHIDLFVFGLERVVLFCLYDRSSRDRLNLDMSKPGPVSLWRPPESAISWDPLKGWFDLDVSAAVNAFQRSERLPGAIFMSREREKLRVARDIHVSDIRRPSQLPWYSGNELSDVECAGCPAEVLTGLSLRTLKLGLPAVPRPIVVICPECSTPNNIPLRRLPQGGQEGQ